MITQVPVPQIHAGHQSQINIHHYTPPHPPSVTLNGRPASPDAINHNSFGIIEAQEREIKTQNDLIDLLKDQVRYWKKKYKKLKKLKPQ